MADLRRKFAEIGDYDGAVKLMEEEIRSIPDAASKIRKLLEIADVYETKIGLIPKALEKYEQVLDLEPSNRKALANLEKGLRSLSAWEQLRELFDGLIPEIKDDAYKAQILFKLGKLYQNQIGDLIRAARCFEMVKEINRGAQSIYKELESLYEKTENWESLVRILKEEAELSLKPGEKTDLLQKARRIASERIEGARAPDSPAASRDPARPEGRAVAVFEPAPDRMRDMEEAIAAAHDPAEKANAFLNLAKLHLDSGNAGKAGECARMAADLLPPGHAAERDAFSLLWKTAGPDECAQVLNARMDVTDDSRTKASLHILLGDLLSSAAARKKEAVREYQAALKMHPENTAAQKALEKLWSETGHKDGLTSLYRWQMSKGAESSGRRGAALKLASLMAEDPAKAAESEKIFRSVLDEDPADLGALRGLESIYKQSKNHAALAEVLLRTAAAYEGAPQALNALFSAARVYRDMLGMPDKAAAAYLRVLAADPENSQAQASLEQTYEDAGDWQGLAGQIRARAEKADSGQRLELLFRLGTMLKDRAGDAAGAAEAYEEIAAEEPQNLEILAELEQIYASIERWEDVAGVINRKLAASPDRKESLRLHLAAGDLWETRLNDLETASIAFEKAASLSPSDPEPLKRLAAIYRRLEKWEDFLRISGRLRDASAAGARPLMLAEAAEVSWRRLGDAQMALELYEQALIMSPGLAEAIRGQQLLYLARSDFAGYANRIILESAYATDAAEKAAKLREAGRILIEAAPLEPNTLEIWEDLASLEQDEEVLAALSAIHRGNENWDKFVEYTLLLASREKDRDKADSLMLDAAQALESQMSKPGGALEIYRRIAERSPENTAAVEGIERLSEEAGDFDAARISLENRLRKDLGPGERAETLEKLGFMLENRAIDFRAASRVFEELYRLDPARPGALAGVERTFLKAGRDHEFLAVLESAAAEGEALVNLKLRAADLRARRLFDLEGAAGGFRSVLELDPANLAAKEGLKDVLGRHGRFEELARLLEDGIEASPGAGAGPLIEAGLVVERRLHEFERAEKLFAAAVERDSANLVALRSLARVRKRLGRWKEHAAALEMQAALLPEEAAADVALEIAGVYEERLHDSAGAARWYETALDLRKTDRRAQIALESVYERTGNADKLVEVLKIRLRSDADDRQKSAICSRLGKLAFDKGDFKAALESYGAALDFIPYSLEALRGVQNSAKKLKDWDACIEALKKEVALHGEAGPRANAHRALSILYQEKGQSDLAMAQLSLAFEAEPGSPEIARELLDLLKAGSRWKELADLLEKSAALLPSAFAKAQALVEAARIAGEKLNDSARARRALERAVFFNPRSEDGLKLLGNILFSTGDHEGLLKLIEKEMQLKPDGPAKSTLLSRSADIVLENLNDPARAARLLVAAVQMDPDNLRALRMLGRLKDDVLREVPKSIRTRLKSEVSREEKIKVIGNAARAASGEKAMDLWKSLLDENPLDIEAMTELGRLCRERSMLREAAIWVSMAASATGDPRRAHRLYMEAGELLESGAGPAPAAFEAFYQAWKADPAAEGLAERLAGSAKELGKWEEYVEIRKAVAETLPSAEKAAALAEIGGIVSRELGNPANAAEFFLAAATLLPDDGNLRSSAVEGLKYSGDFENLCRLLSREYEALSSRGAKAAALAAEIGDLYASKIGDLNFAVEWYYKSVKEDPSDAAVLRKMQDVLRRAGKYRDLEEVLDLEISLDSTALPRRIELMEMKARLYEESLVDEAMAIDSLEALLKEKHGDVEILRRIERVCRRGGYWFHLAGVFERLAGKAASNQEKLEYLLKEAEVFTSKMSDPVRALEAVRRAIEADPGSRKAQELLAELTGFSPQGG